MRPLGLGLLAGIMATTQGAAEPCVGDSFDRPFPGATSVETRFADIPSPNFPGLWQEGRIDGYPYRIYANGEASLQDGGSDPLWSIDVLCPGDSDNCTQSVTGTPPEVALGIATRLGLCFVAPDRAAVPVAPPPAPPPVTVTPEAAPSEPPVAAPTVTAPKVTAPCGLAALPEGEPGITLQLLLVAAGGDPGPIDGLPGALTRDALGQILGPEAEGLTAEAAIAALDAFLCKAPE